MYAYMNERKLKDSNNTKNNYCFEQPTTNFVTFATTLNYIQLFSYPLSFYPLYLIVQEPTSVFALSFSSRHKSYRYKHSQYSRDSTIIYYLPKAKKKHRKPSNLQEYLLID